MGSSEDVAHLDIHSLITFLPFSMYSQAFLLLLLPKTQFYLKSYSCIFPLSTLPKTVLKQNTIPDTLIKMLGNIAPSMLAFFTEKK
jgi:hypothetical protein